MNIKAKLQELGLELPTPPKPVAAYVPFVQSGNLVYVSGQLPLENGQIAYRGLLGEHLTVEEGYQAARLCALNGLAILDDALGGDWNRLVRIVRVGGFVASTPTFVDHPKVINGASELLGELLGDQGRHARAAVGVSALPLEAAVEVELLAEIR